MSASVQGGKFPSLWSPSHAQGSTREISTVDTPSVLSDAAMNGPLGKAPSKCKGPRCQLVTAASGLGHVQGTWLILACASVFEIKGSFWGTHAPNNLQFCKSESIPWICNPNVVPRRERKKNKGEEKKKKRAIVLLLILTSDGLALFWQQRPKSQVTKGWISVRRPRSAEADGHRTPLGLCIADTEPLEQSKEQSPCCRDKRTPRTGRDPFSMTLLQTRILSGWASASLLFGQQSADTKLTEVSENKAFHSPKEGNITQLIPQHPLLHPNLHSTTESGHDPSSRDLSREGKDGATERFPLAARASGSTDTQPCPASCPDIPRASRCSH